MFLKRFKQKHFKNIYEETLLNVYTEMFYMCISETVVIHLGNTF